MLASSDHVCMLKRIAALGIVLLFSLPLLGSGGDVIAGHSARDSNPAPFNSAADWEKNRPAISTGYYFIDSQEQGTEPAAPKTSELRRDLDQDQHLWFRITSGPNQYSSDHWEQNPEGQTYFRNPGDMNDSTDNAFAGPINIGFDFEFNGVRYDSIYVSSNGLIALTNRRYFYNSNGRRIKDEVTGEAWDPQGDDPRRRLDPFNTDGLNDETADDWGYQFVACGGDPADPLAGIRSPFNSALGDAAIVNAGLVKEAAVIAPLWDDWQLPQYDPLRRRVIDYGQVWYKRSADNTELAIKFVNLVPLGSKRHPLPGRADVEFAKNERVGRDGAFAVSATVILNSIDNSVSVLYEAAEPANLEFMKAGVPAWDLVAANASVGLRGQARFEDDVAKERRYLQYTEYLRDGQLLTEPQAAAEAAGLSIAGLSDEFALRFKQYKNILRVVDIDYMIIDPQTREFTHRIEDVEDFEVLIGNQFLGTVLPVVTYQNLSNDVQGEAGVNYQEQGFDFRANLLIRNSLISDTIIYRRDVCVNDFALLTPAESGVRLVNAAGEPLPYTGGGIPSYAFIETIFPQMKTNQFLPNHYGHWRVTASAEGLSCVGEPLSEEWDKDNSLSVRAFGLRILNSFRENFSEFNYTAEHGAQPLAGHWINFGAEVVSGSEHTLHPPPPRDDVKVPGNPDLTISSPVVRLNRLDLNGREQAAGGDELRSMPIDVRGRSQQALTFSYQRAGRPPSGAYDRGWSDLVRIGPEARVVENGDWETTEPLQHPDVLELHFANPSPDQYNNIVNIPDEGWSRHPDLRTSGEFITDNPVFTVFGGGGYRVGFDEENLDSALTAQQGLRPLSLDSGKDREFLKAFIDLPEHIEGAPNDAARYFRFKFVVKAQNHGPANSSINGPLDDADDFYIDNVAIVRRTENPDLEVSSIEVLPGPVQMWPASQAQRVNINATVVNNSTEQSRAVGILVQIAEANDPAMRLLYQRAQALPFIRPQQQVRRAFPAWYARGTRPGRYLVCASIFLGARDNNESNDSTHTFYDLDFADVIAYDTPSRRGVNDLATFAGQAGKGLNLGAVSSGAFTSASAYGADAGDQVGAIALRYEQTSFDTLWGYQLYFGGMNDSPDQIRISLHNDDNGKPSETPIAGSVMRRRRALFDLDALGDPAPPAPEMLLDQYGTYVLDEKLILQRGDYWMVVEQSSQTGFELGASAARMGMQTLNYSNIPVLGVNGNSVLNEHYLREENRGLYPPMRNLFMYRNYAGDDVWTQFTPPSGNPAYAHLGHSGQVGTINTYTRASWVPMMRLYYGERTYADPPSYIDGFKPVELSEFAGSPRPPVGNELYWETASEIDNAGFFVERRLTAQAGEFASIGFVNGAGSSSIPKEYSLMDQDVQAGQSYAYRLRQVDFDGTATLSKSIVLRYDVDSDFRVNNRPNPFVNSTDISFAVPFKANGKANVKLQICDLFGTVVRTLHAGDLKATSQHTISWDTRNDHGQQCAAGLYYCRLQIGSEHKVHVMQLIR